MQIVRPRPTAVGDQVFGGKVRVTIFGISTRGWNMTNADGLPSKSFTISDTTVEEVYDLLYSVIRDYVSPVRREHNGNQT
jgi:hypothetical protein